MSCASAISVAIPRALASTDPTDVIAMPAWEIAVRIFVAAVLLCFSALFSGLTLGVMGLDKSSLHVIMESGGEVERDQAKRIMAVRTDGNLLLVTLLLGNVAVNSLISILTAELTSGAVGFALSTVLIVMLGEVLPQAACSRHGLALGAKFVPLVRVIVALLFPISKPIALGLDYWLGEEVRATGLVSCCTCRPLDPPPSPHFRSARTFRGPSSARWCACMPRASCWSRPRRP